MEKDADYIKNLFGPQNSFNNSQSKSKTTIHQQTHQKLLQQKQKSNHLAQITLQNQNKFRSNTKLIITGEFCQQCFQKLSNQIAQSNAKIIKIKKVQRPIFLKQIQHIKFQSLRVLILANCGIQNIEALHLTDMSGLRYLDLQQNLITNVKSMLKCFGVSNPIIEMNLNQNPILSISQRQWVRRLNFSKKDNINRFKLANMKTSFETFQDFTYLIPFQLRNQKNLKSIDMANQPKNRPKVKQAKLFKMLNQIFPHAKVNNSKSSSKMNTFNNLFGIQQNQHYNQQKYYQKGYDYRYNQDNDPYDSQKTNKESNIICLHYQHIKKTPIVPEEQLPLLINRQFFSNQISFFSQENIQIKIVKKSFQNLKKKLDQDFQYKNLCINSQIYIQIFQKIFKLIKQSSIQVLETQYCNKKSILKDIKNIQFTQLKTLNLSSSMINNIQTLSFIYAPKLKILNLSGNNISIVKSLVKSFGVQNAVTQLKLDRNRMVSINDRQWMRKIIFKQQEKLSCFMVTKKQHQKLETIFQDFTYFIPFQLVQYNQNSKFIYIDIDMTCQNNRLQQPKLFKMLKEIFPTCYNKNSRTNKIDFKNLFGF